MTLSQLCGVTLGGLPLRVRAGGTLAALKSAVSSPYKSVYCLASQIITLVALMGGSFR